MIGVLMVVPLMATAVAVLFAAVRVFWNMGEVWGWHVTAATTIAAIYAFVAFVPTILGWAEWMTACMTQWADKDSLVRIEYQWLDYDKWTGVFEKFDGPEGRMKTTYFCPLPCIVIKISWNGVEP